MWANLRHWVWNCLYNLDRLGNALTGGDPQETISSRLGRNRDTGGRIGRWGCAVLDWIEPGHCESAEDHTHEIEDLPHDGPSAG